jgi:hypothetical protein
MDLQLGGPIDVENFVRFIQHSEIFDNLKGRNKFVSPYSQMKIFFFSTIHFQPIEIPQHQH